MMRVIIEKNRMSRVLPREVAEGLETSGNPVWTN